MTQIQVTRPRQVRLIFPWAYLGFALCEVVRIAQGERLHGLTYYRQDGVWFVSEKEGVTRLGEYSAALKAGEMNKIMRELFPDAQIGFRSDVFGVSTKAVYGDVVWMESRP